MKISLNWLKQYVNIENIPLDDLLNKLTLSGLEVEDVYDESSKLKNIVVGFVKEKRNTPTLINFPFVSCLQETKTSR